MTKLPGVSFGEPTPGFSRSDIIDELLWKGHGEPPRKDVQFIPGVPEPFRRKPDGHPPD